MIVNFGFFGKLNFVCVKVFLVGDWGCVYYFGDSIKLRIGQFIVVRLFDCLFVVIGDNYVVIEILYLKLIDIDK